MSTIYDLDADIKPQWKTNEHFLDYTEIHGLALSKLVRETDSSRYTGIAGKDIRTIRIIDLAFMGADNWYLRAISAGRFVRLEFLRSNKEGHFIHHLLRRLRQQKDTAAQISSASSPKDELDKDASIDLDIIGEAVAAKEKLGFNTVDEKKIVYFKMADICYDALKNYAPRNDMKKIQEELKSLQEKLASATAENTQLKNAEKLPAKRKKGLESFFKNQGDAKEDEDQEADEGAEPHDIFDEIRRVGRQKKVLKTTAPSGARPKDVEDWIKKQLNLSAEKQKKVEAQVTTMYNSFMKLDVPKRTGIKELCVDWGLAVDVAAKLDAKQAIKVCAYAKATL